MVFLRYKATAASEPDGKWGQSPSSFHSAFVSISSPLNIFYFGSQGLDRVLYENTLYLFPKIKGNEF